MRSVSHTETNRARKGQDNTHLKSFPSKYLVCVPVSMRGHTSSFITLAVLWDLVGRKPEYKIKLVSCSFCVGKLFRALESDECHGLSEWVVICMPVSDDVLFTCLTCWHVLTSAHPALNRTP